MTVISEGLLLNSKYIKIFNFFPVTFSHSWAPFVFPALVFTFQLAVKRFYLKVLGAETERFYSC